jgi:prolyl 4-hydroxylase
MDAALERRAGAGDRDAQIALAREYEKAARHDLARGWYGRAAKSGDAAALRLLAVSLLTQDPIMVRDGAAMIRQAAAMGDAPAAHLCAVLAAQDTALAQNWRIAREYLTRAAMLGHDHARAQLDLLGSGDIGARAAAPTARTAFESPRIAVIEGFASISECDWLIARARPALEPATVYNPSGAGGLRADDIRDNSAAQFDIGKSDVVMCLLRARIAHATGLSSDDMEPAMVLHYEAGQQFAPHYDFIDPDLPRLSDDVARRGQRVATFLLYLSDDHEGGETAFVDLGWRHRGAKGDALVFWNVRPDGTPDRGTRHAGLAPTRGEKWLLSQWIRAR